MKLFELLGSIVVNNREANEEIDDTTKKAEDSSSKIGKAFSSIGSGIAKGVGGAAKIAGKAILGIGAAAATGVTAFLATAESTREYREELSKLTNMAKQVGTSSDYIKDKWMSMSAVLGDEGAVTEGLNNIMAAGFTTQESIDGITEVLEGAALKWKDTLKFEGLADGLQETLATGAATGSFAEMLERSGVVLDDFNAGLATCSTEAEKQDYIMKTLSETGLADVSKAYRDANGDMISAAEAQSKLTDKIAEIGAIAEPIMTTLKLVAVDLLDTIMPFVTLIGEGLQGALNGTAGAAEKLGEGLSGGIAAVLDMVVGALPTIITTISTMAPTLIQAVSDSVGQILTVISGQGPKIMGLILDILMGLGDIIIENAPLLLDALLSIITAFTEKIPTMIPQLVQGLLTLFMGLVDHLPELITALVTLITSLASALVEQLPVILPTLIQGVMDLILGLVDQLPTIISAIVELLVQFWTIMGEQLPVIYPQLLDAAAQIVFALIEALPEILGALITALPVYLQMVWDTITGVFSGLVSWYGDLFSQAKDKIIEVFQPIVDWFREKWDNIKETFSDVGSWFGDKFREAWNNIKSAFSNFTSFFSGLWDKIKSTFSSLGTKLGSAIGDSVKSGINSVLSMIEDTINKAIGLINGAIDLINKVSPKDIGHIGTLSLPRLAKGGVLYDDTAFIGGEYANAATNPEIVTPQNIMAETFDKVLTAKLSLISDLQNDRLDRILALLSDYIPQLGNQKIVLDTGALVGEMVEPMDDALGERAEAKQRNRYS